MGEIAGDVIAHVDDETEIRKYEFSDGPRYAMRGANGWESHWWPAYFFEQRAIEHELQAGKLRAAAALIQTHAAALAAEPRPDEAGGEVDPLAQAMRDRIDEVKEERRRG